MDSINNEAARVITGAFRSSPINSLLAEANLLPLQTRRTKLLLNYACKVLSTKNHQNYGIFANIIADAHKYSIKAHFQKFLLLRQIDIPPILLSDQWIPDKPPWRSKEINLEELIDFSILEDIRSTNAELEERTDIFRRTIRNKYKNYTFIYTDASVKEFKVGCAVILPDTIIKKRLHNYYSIFSAEALAILLALETFLINTNFVICSDSAAVLSAIRSVITVITPLY